MFSVLKFVTEFFKIQTTSLINEEKYINNNLKQLQCIYYAILSINAIKNMIPIFCLKPRLLKA